MLLASPSIVIVRGRRCWTAGASYLLTNRKKRMTAALLVVNENIGYLPISSLTPALFQKFSTGLSTAYVASVLNTNYLR